MLFFLFFFFFQILNRIKTIYILYSIYSIPYNLSMFMKPKSFYWCFFNYLLQKATNFINLMLWCDTCRSAGSISWETLAAASGCCPLLFSRIWCYLNNCGVFGSLLFVCLSASVRFSCLFTFDFQLLLCTMWVLFVYMFI